jgi:putative ABC transport system permease protein
MFDYALKNIARRWVRSLLTILGIAVMLTLIIVITGIVNSQKRTVHAHASASAGKINVQPRLSGTTYPADGIDLAEDMASDVLERVNEWIQPHLSAQVLYFSLRSPLYPNQPPEIILTGITPGKEEAFTGSIANDIQPTAGVETFLGVNIPHPVILGAHASEVYARESGAPLTPGNTLTLLDQEFTVIGILDKSGDIVVNNAVIIPLSEAQSLLDKQGFVSSVILTQARLNADQKIAATIQEYYPRLNIVDNSTIRKNMQAGIRLFEAMVNAISMVVLVATTLLIVTVMLITVKERTREIGVLRAMGVSTMTVSISVLWEIFLLSATGSLLGGVLSGLILRFALMENLFNLVHILSYLPLAILLTLVSGVMPAVQISRVQPVISLQYE